MRHFLTFAETRYQRKTTKICLPREHWERLAAPIDAQLSYFVFAIEQLSFLLRWSRDKKPITRRWKQESSKTNNKIDAESLETTKIFLVCAIWSWTSANEKKLVNHSSLSLSSAITGCGFTDTKNKWFTVTFNTRDICTFYVIFLMTLVQQVS